MSTSQVSQEVSNPSARESSEAPEEKASLRRDAPALKEHLDQLFPPLNFPPELAARILTHSSHPDAVHSHNARMSFIGMRILD